MFTRILFLFFLCTSFTAMMGCREDQRNSNSHESGEDSADSEKNESKKEAKKGKESKIPTDEPTAASEWLEMQDQMALACKCMVTLSPVDNIQEARRSYKFFMQIANQIPRGKNYEFFLKWDRHVSGPFVRYYPERVVFYLDAIKGPKAMLDFVLKHS